MEPMTNSVESLLESLQDVGCTPQQIESIATAIAVGDKETARRLLRRHRRTLMDELHISQQKVDRLDFLIYSLPEL